MEFSLPPPIEPFKDEKEPIRALLDYAFTDIEENHLIKKDNVIFHFTYQAKKNLGSPYERH